MWLNEVLFHSIPLGRLKCYPIVATVEIDGFAVNGGRCRLLPLAAVFCNDFLVVVNDFSVVRWLKILAGLLSGKRRPARIMRGSLCYLCDSGGCWGNGS